MPPEVAGVTFLAFGNGAPDVFSAFVALTSSLDRQQGLLVGMGSLLGSSEPRFFPPCPPADGPGVEEYVKNGKSRHFRAIFTGCVLHIKPRKYSSRILRSTRLLFLK